VNLPGSTELIIILVIILLLFGAKKLPEMARSIGKSSGEFKKGLAEGDSDEKPAPESESKSEAKSEPGAEKKTD